MLQSHMGFIIRQPSDSIQIRHSPRHHIGGTGLTQLNIQTRKEQIVTNPEIFPHIPNEGLQNSLTRGTLSNRRANAHRPSSQLI